MLKKDKPKIAPYVMSKKVAQGEAVNHFRLISSKEEYIIDFGKIMPGSEVTPILARITTVPSGAKALAIMLTNAIKEYEAKYGVIEIKVRKGSFVIDTSMKN